MKVTYARALNAGWYTIFTAGDSRMMGHRVYGPKWLHDIEEYMVQ